MTLEQELEKIVEGPGTKADRARALFGLGCDRTDVIELLDMSYSQAHSIWKVMQNGSGADRSSDSGHPRPAKPQSVVGRGREDSSKGPGYPRFVRASLRLSPTQTRVLFQDGHRVIRVDHDGGPLCRNCKAPLTFSLAHLGFVHTHSKKEPTGMEENYG